VKKYFIVAKLSFEDILEYRFDFFMHVMKYSMMVLMMSLIWIAVLRENNSLTFSIQDTVVYFACAAIVYSLSNFHPYYVEEDIRLGTLSKYLVKPMSPFLYYFFFEATHSFFEVFVRAVVLIPVFWFFGIQLHLTLINLVLFLIFLPVIFFFTFSLLLSISQGAFWIHDIFAVRWTLNIFFRFLSGVLVPIVFFPPQLRQIMFYLPFQHLAFTPIQILQGKLSVNTALQSLAILLAWTVVVAYIRAVIWKKGIHQYEGTGI
jgi:ABC-2 type transport system permease protein